MQRKDKLTEWSIEEQRLKGFQQQVRMFSGQTVLTFSDSICLTSALAIL